MKRNILSVIICLLIFASISIANDGVFYVEGNTLIPLQETQVELRKEILKFHITDYKWMDVDVDFTFYNPGKAKSVTVGFVTPPAIGDIDEEDERHPRIKDFTVNVNGENLAYKMKRMSETSFQAVDKEINGRDFVYYFSVNFKKGINKIKHTYRFHGGSSIETLRNFSYQITTGKRWANKQIDDFELQIHPGRGIFYIPLSFKKNNEPADWQIKGKGVFSEPQNPLFSDEKPDSRLVHIREGYLSLREKNFKPDTDISIGEYNWILWYRRLCKNEDKCYEAEEIGQNVFSYLFENPGERLSEEFLAKFNKRDLQIIRKLPYAMRGYDFKEKWLKDFYLQFFWYQPDADLKLSDIKLSDDDELLMKKILNVESKN